MKSGAGGLVVAPAAGTENSEQSDEKTSVEKISEWVPKNVKELDGDPTAVAKEVVKLIRKDDMNSMKRVPAEELTGPLLTAVGLPDALAIVSALKEEDPTWSTSPCVPSRAPALSSVVRPSRASVGAACVVGRVGACRRCS